MAAVRQGLEMRSPLMPPAVDWQRLALDLRMVGHSLTTAAKQVGAHPDYLRQLARGEIREPKFTQGVALLNLHCEILGTDATRKLRK